MGDHKHRQCEPDPVEISRNIQALKKENEKIPQYKTQYVQIPPHDSTCEMLEKILNARHAEGYKYMGYLQSTTFEVILIFEKK